MDIENSSLQALPSGELQHILCLVAACPPPAGTKHDGLVIERLGAAQLASRRLCKVARSLISSSVATMSAIHEQPDADTLAEACGQQGPAIQGTRTAPVNHPARRTARQSRQNTAHHTINYTTIAQFPRLGHLNISKAAGRRRWLLRFLSAAGRRHRRQHGLKSSHQTDDLRLQRLQALQMESGTFSHLRAPLPATLTGLTKLVLLCGAATADCSVTRPPWLTLSWSRVSDALLALPMLTDLTLSEAPLCSHPLAAALPQMTALRSLTLRWAAFEAASVPAACVRWLPRDCSSCFFVGATQLRALALPAALAVACGCGLAALSQLTSLDAVGAIQDHAAVAAAVEQLLCRRRPRRREQRHHHQQPPTPTHQHRPLLPLPQQLLALQPESQPEALSMAAAPQLPSLHLLVSLSVVVFPRQEAPLLRALSGLRLGDLQLVAGWRRPANHQRHWWEEDQPPELQLPRDEDAWQALSSLTSLSLAGFEEERQLPPPAAVRRHLTGLVRLRVAGVEAFNGSETNDWLDALAGAKRLGDLELEPQQTTTAMFASLGVCSQLTSLVIRTSGPGYESEEDAVIYDSLGRLVRLRHLEVDLPDTIMLPYNWRQQRRLEYAAADPQGQEGASAADAAGGNPLQKLVALTSLSFSVLQGALLCLRPALPALAAPGNLRHLTIAERLSACGGCRRCRAKGQPRKVVVPAELRRMTGLERLELRHKLRREHWRVPGWLTEMASLQHLTLPGVFGEEDPSDDGEDATDWEEESYDGASEDRTGVISGHGAAIDDARDVPAGHVEASTSGTGAAGDAACQGKQGGPWEQMQVERLPALVRVMGMQSLRSLTLDEAFRHSMGLLAALRWGPKLVCKPLFDDSG